jgi:hypothetical protein
LTSSLPSRLSNRTVSARYVLFTTSIMSLRFLTDQPRKSRPGNLAVGRPDYHVCIVPGVRVRSNAGIRSSSVVLRKHCCARYFVSLFISLGWEEISRAVSIVMLDSGPPSQKTGSPTSHHAATRS